MSVVAILLALLCIGLLAVGMMCFARPKGKLWTLLMLLALCLVLSRAAFWFGRMTANMDNNAYYTFRIKKLVESTVKRLEATHNASSLAEDFRRLNDRFQPTYEKRPNLDALFAEVEGVRSENSSDAKDGGEGEQE